jgi:hypothetical protein
VLLKDVKATPALDIGQRKFGAVSSADQRVGKYSAENERSKPTQGNLAPVAVTPTSKLREQETAPVRGKRGY